MSERVSAWSQEQFGSPSAPRFRAGRRRTTAVCASVVLVLAGAAGVAAAGTASGETPSGSAASSGSPKRSAALSRDGEGIGDGAAHLCRRAGRIDRRIDRALDRLNGGVRVRGSIARLEKRIDAAGEEGHQEIETFLKHRLTFRKSLVDTLEQRRKDLAEVKEWCEENGQGQRM